MTIDESPYGCTHHTHKRSVAPVAVQTVDLEPTARPFGAVLAQPTHARLHHRVAGNVQRPVGQVQVSQPLQIGSRDRDESVGAHFFFTCTQSRIFSAKLLQVPKPVNVRTNVVMSAGHTKADGTC